MELGSGEETFKYIPFRVYQLSKDSGVIQRLIKPLTEQGNRKTLGCLIQELFPEETSSSKSKLFYTKKQIAYCLQGTKSSLAKQNLARIQVTSCASRTVLR